jgi:hypothetical protein
MSRSAPVLDFAILLVRFPSLRPRPRRGQKGSCTMFHTRSMKLRLLVVPLPALLPFLLGGCPPNLTPGGGATPPGTNPSPTTLLNEQVASNPAPAIGPLDNPCAGAAAGFGRTFNAVSGRVVTVTVTGPVTASRPQIRIADILGNQVANTGPTPSTQSTTTTFTPSGNNLYILQVNECAAVAPGGVYTVLITQA